VFVKYNVNSKIPMPSAVLFLSLGIRTLREIKIIYYSFQNDAKFALQLRVKDTGSYFYDETKRKRSYFENYRERTRKNLWQILFAKAF